MSYLILVRHGESRWNIANRFTGWVDVPLSTVGIHEALIAAQKLKGLRFDVAYTSDLRRAQETLLLILSQQDATGVFMHSDKKGKEWAKHQVKMGRDEVPIYHHSAINERYYGALQGMDKDAARKKFGKQKVFTWRRSWDVAPPKGESLKDTYKRSLPYFKSKILKDIKSGKNVIVAAHGNSLRAIIKYIEGISDDKIPLLELPTGKPIVYKYFRGKLTPQDHIHSFDRPIDWKKDPKVRVR